MSTVSDMELILSSKYFDAAYYHAARSDVLAAGVDAAHHYMTQGWKEGANPSLDFITNLYLAYNPSRGCPLVQYLRRGAPGYYGAVATPDEIERYWQYKSQRQAKTVCYTYISGKYDNLMSHRHIVPDWDYVCFTDNEQLLRHNKIGIWQILPSRCTQYEPKRNSGWHKTHPEILGPDYDYSVWVDGNVCILTSFLEDTIKIRQEKMLVPIHYARDCIFDEVHAVIKLGNTKNCLGTAKFLQKEKMPEHYGLNETNIMFRSMHDETIRSVNAMWWDCILNYSRRDQLSFSYVLYRHGISPYDIAIPNARMDNTNYILMIHKK